MGEIRILFEKIPVKLQKEGLTMESMDNKESYLRIMNALVKDVVSDCNNICYEVIAEDNTAVRVGPADDEEEKKDEIKLTIAEKK